MTKWFALVGVAVIYSQLCILLLPASLSWVFGLLGGFVLGWYWARIWRIVAGERRHG